MKNRLSIPLAAVYSVPDYAERNQNVEHVKAMNELKKIYWHEKQLLLAIPFLLKTAATFELVESLTTLGQYTKDHIEKLEAEFPAISKVA